MIPKEANRLLGAFDLTGCKLGRQSDLTGFLDVHAIFRAAGLRAEAHQVDGEDSEDVLVPHDEVRYDTVGSSVLIKHRIPLLQRNHSNIRRLSKAKVDA